MSRNFVQASGQNLVYGSALADIPMTLAGFGYSTLATTAQTVISIGDTAASVDYFSLQFNGIEVGDPIQSVGKRGTTTQIAETTTGYSINTWHHAAAVFAAVDDARVYIDGGSKGTSSTSVNPIGEDTTYIGRRVNAIAHADTIAYGWNGRLAEVAIWNVALTDAEVVILANGYSPLFVRPQNLVFYAPIEGVLSPEPDLVGGYDMTLNNGPTAATHPIIHYPVRTLFTVPDIGGMISV